jgi:hypothetical protein
MKFTACHAIRPERINIGANNSDGPVAHPLFTWAWLKMQRPAADGPLVINKEQEIAYVHELSHLKIPTRSFFRTRKFFFSSENHTSRSRLRYILFEVIRLQTYLLVIAAHIVIELEIRHGGWSKIYPFT